MPARSKAIRRAAAIAEHHPEQLYARNRSLLKVSKSQLHDFAATKESGLPERARRQARRPAGQFRRKRSPARIQRDIRKGWDYRI